MKKLFLFLFLGLFLVSFTSAILDATIENAELKEDLKLSVSESASKYPSLEIKSFFGLGETKAQLVLTEHDETCGDTCLSEFTIVTFEESSLIDDIRFYTLSEDGVNFATPKEQPIRNYEIYYWGEKSNYEIQCTNGEYNIENGSYNQNCENVEIEKSFDWIPLNLGQELTAGTYQIRLMGEKRPNRAVDWIIETQGRIINEWAVWGSGGNRICYQESTNTTNQVGTDAQDCGLVYNGTYASTGTISSLSSAFDGSYSTSAVLSGGAIFYVNYTKPATALNSSKWRVKAGGAGTDTNYSLVNSCWSAYSNKIVLRYTDIASNNIQCFNTTTWVTLGSVASSSLFTEEGMNWNVTTNANINLTYPLNGQTTYNTSTQFNATINISNGANLINASLCTNVTGSWLCDNTSTFASSSINKNFSDGNNYLFASGNGNLPGADWSSLSVNSNDGFGANNNSYEISPAGTYWMVSRAHQLHTVYLNRTINASEETRTLNLTYICRNDGGTLTVINCWVSFYNSSGLIGAEINIPDASTTSSFSTTIPRYATKIAFRIDNTGSGSFGSSFQFYNMTSNITATNFQNVSFYKVISPGTYTWNVQACDSDNTCGFASSNYTFTVDSTAPTITILGGNGSQNFGSLVTNYSITYFVNDTNLASCWIAYNGTNRTDACVNAVPKYYNFSLQQGIYNLTIFANDTLGNVRSLPINWSFKILQTNVSYNPTSIEGNSENYGLNLTLSSGYDLTNASFFYNGTYVSTNSLISSGNFRYSNVTDFTVPEVDNGTNFTFYWTLTLNDSTAVNTSMFAQLVTPVKLDNCSSYTFRILNINLYDERTRNPMNGTIEVIYQVLNVPTYELVHNLTGIFENVSSVNVCSEINLSGQNFAYSTQFKYYQSAYVSELYNIQRATFVGEQNVSLFDLEEAESTSFLIKYQNDDLIKVADAVVQLQRKYIPQDVYEVVEAPLTSSEGTAVVHIDLDANIYRATIVKNGEVLDVFDNLAFNCENPLAGQCEQNLYGLLDPQNEVSVDTLNDFASEITEVGNNTLQIDFTIPSSTPASVNIVMVQKDIFGNTTTCNTTVYSSAGSVQCGFNESLTQSYIDLIITKNSVPMSITSYVVEEDLGDLFGGNNFFIIIIFALSLIGMAITSPEFIVINGIVTLIIAGGLGLANGLNLVMGLGGLAWIIVAGIIIIVKLAKQEDR